MVYPSKIGDMKKKIFINICDFVVRINFLETENVLIQKEWIEQVEKYWGDLILKRDIGRVDYVVDFVDLNGGVDLFLEKKEGDYYQTMQRIKKKKKTRIAYSAGLIQFNNVLKDLLLGLIKDDGFLMHASSCVNNKGDVSEYVNMFFM